MASTANGNGNPARPVPPYVPYRTFLTFLDSLKVGVPSHIDKSVLKSMSGGMQGWLKAALRAMKLIDQASVPQEMLYELASTEGEARKERLRSVFKTTYGFLDDSVELEVTTPAKLESAFVATGATGDTVRKAVSFMLAMAKDADVELSPHLLKRGALPKRQPPRQPVSKKSRTPEDKPDGEPDTKNTPPPKGSSSQDWMDQLLTKFPNFDPAWPDDLKAKWFEGFERLMSARKL